MKNILHKIASVRITVICLFWLFVLTFWGTVAQVDHGLYAAQQRYFFSLFFFVFKFIPLPGAQLALWILFINLTASVIVHFSKMRHWRFIGLKMSHAGVLVYFIAAFITFRVTQESYVHLAQGEGTNVSSSYDQWELAFWSDPGDVREVSAIDLNHVKQGQWVDLPQINAKVLIYQFYRNASAYKGPQRMLNASGIASLEPKELLKEREKNVAGGIFQVADQDNQKQEIILYGAESIPTPVMLNGRTYYFALRHQRHVLPFTIKLKEFKAQFHPGTEVAKSYESMVEIIKGESQRDVRIYMNNPLREKDYTFYQASYDTDSMGRMYSTLAVVKNAGQILPYIASIMVFLGLAIHFMIMAMVKKKK